MNHVATSQQQNQGGDSMGSKRKTLADWIAERNVYSTMWTDGVGLEERTMEVPLGFTHEWRYCGCEPNAHGQHLVILRPVGADRLDGEMVCGQCKVRIALTPE